MRVALARFQAGDYASAARALERAARTGPPSFNVEYYLGRSLVELTRMVVRAFTRGLVAWVEGLSDHAASS